MKIKLLAFLFFVAFVLMSSSASATDYYLSTTGDNGNTGISIADAWLTPQYAFSQLTAGDTLYIIDGVYTVTSTCDFDNSGTEENPILVTAYNGTPEITWPAATSEAQHVIDFDSQSWITVDGLKITTIDGRNVHFTGDDQHNTLQNNVVLHSGASNSNAVHISSGSSYITILNNTFGNHSAGNSSTQNFIDFGCVYPSALVHDVIISDNYFYKISDHNAINLRELYNTVDTKVIWNVEINNNTFEDIIEYSTGTLPIATNYISLFDSDISNNTFINCTKSISVYANNCTLNNNTIFEAADGGTVGIGTNDRKIYNSTYANNNASLVLYGEDITVIDNAPEKSVEISGASSVVNIANMTGYQAVTLKYEGSVILGDNVNDTFSIAKESGSDSYTYDAGTRLLNLTVDATTIFTVNQTFDDTGGDHAPEYVPLTNQIYNNLINTIYSNGSISWSRTPLETDENISEFIFMSVGGSSSPNETVVWVKDFDDGTEENFTTYVDKDAMVLDNNVTYNSSAYSFRKIGDSNSYAEDYDYSSDINTSVPYTIEAKVYDTAVTGDNIWAFWLDGGTVSYYIGVDTRGYGLAPDATSDAYFCYRIDSTRYTSSIERTGDTWETPKFEWNGTHINAYINDNLLFTYAESSSPTTVAIGSKWEGFNDTYYDDVKLYTTEGGTGEASIDMYPTSFNMSNSSNILSWVDSNNTGTITTKTIEVVTPVSNATYYLSYSNMTNITSSETGLFELSDITEGEYILWYTVPEIPIPLNFVSTSPSGSTISIYNTSALTVSGTTNKTANFTFYIDSVLMQTNTSVTAATYVNDSIAIGTHNLTMLASVGGESVNRVWTVTVSEYVAPSEDTISLDLTVQQIITAIILGGLIPLVIVTVILFSNLNNIQIDNSKMVTVMIIIAVILVLTVVILNPLVEWI